MAKSLVPTVRAEVLHRAIQTRGLEESADLIALATPAQLARVLDVDLWRAPAPGADEVLDAERFGLWIAVLMQAGAAVAADKLAGLDTALVVAGLAQYLSVFDQGAVSPFITLEGELTESRDVRTGPIVEMGGYAIEIRRPGAWDAIVELLAFLDAERPEYFHRLMYGCLRLSSGSCEDDGCDELLEDTAQQLFDVSAAREARREEQGFVTPAAADAFLREGRALRFDGERPAPGAIARGYFRAIGSVAAGSATLAPPASDGLAHAHQSLVHAYAAAHARADEEVAFLANVIVAGVPILGRPFTPREAWDGALAVCNLGLENWPSHWSSPDLCTAFQAGWTVLFRDVSMFAAKRLAEVLAEVRCVDRDIQLRLDRLRYELRQCLQDGTPWQARPALEIVMMLDAPSWAALSALLDRFPVMHAAVTASARGRRTISPTDFTFVSENADVSAVRAFVDRLPAALSG